MRRESSAAQSPSETASATPSSLPTGDSRVNHRFATNIKGLDTALTVPVPSSPDAAADEPTLAATITTAELQAALDQVTQELNACVSRASEQETTPAELIADEEQLRQAAAAHLSQIVGAARALFTQHQVLHLLAYLM